MIDAANIAIPPNLGVKQVEVCNIPQPGDSETPSHGNPNPQASPPYDVPVLYLFLPRTLLNSYQKPPRQVPTAGRSEQVCQGANSAINKPTIIPSSYAARPTNESSKVELRGPVHHLYHEEVKGIRKPSLDIALSPPTHPGVGELGGVDCSGYGLDFPESLGDETMDLIAAMGPGLMCAVSSTNSNQLLHANDELVELGVTELNMGEDVAGIRSNASSDGRPISFDKINKPSSDHVGDGFSTRGSSPAGRLPSFSGFDAIPSDCVGCCLHPPTQQLPSQCHSRAVSPAPGPLGAKILRIQSLCAHASPLRLQPPSSLNTPTDHGGEVNPRSVSPASLNEIVTPLQNLKRPNTADKAHNTYRKLLEIQSHNLNMQSHNLKMQMALNEILVCVLTPTP